MPQEYNYGNLEVKKPAYDYGGLEVKVSAKAPPPPAIPAAPPTPSQVALKPYPEARGQRGQSPFVSPSQVKPQFGQRGAAPQPSTGPGAPAPPRPPSDESLLDPLIDFFGQRVQPHLPKLYKDFLAMPMPVREAIGDTIRSLATRENVGIMGGIAAANVIPVVGTAVDI